MRKLAGSKPDFIEVISAEEYDALFQVRKRRVLCRIQCRTRVRMAYALPSPQVGFTVRRPADGHRDHPAHLLS
jgi:hypothetical protein